tara:strand:- start:42 stop:1091 length:1050 start_codon:yes stop_codon:yes gene_type:complete
MKFTRHTNFSQAPKFIKTITDKDPVFTIPVLGDLVNSLWLEGFEKNSNVSSNLLYNSTIDLYVGGQKIDSQHYDYYADIWPNYLADTWTKSQELTNKTSVSHRNFQPLHFFFCDYGAFLPLVALQHHQVEIRINFDQASLLNYSDGQKRINVYANYIYLDKDERESMVKRQMDFIITQTQRIDFPFSNVFDNTIESGGYNDLDISTLNHPVKSIFFGLSATNIDPTNDRFTFKTGDIHINGTPLLENMSPTYFHTCQNYYKSRFGVTDYRVDSEDLMYTRFFVYHFGLNASDYNPSGSCNFSRLDNAKLILRGVEKGVLRADQNEMYLYAVNYNVLRIKDGLAGILFGN